MAGRKPGSTKTGGRGPGSVNKKTAEAQELANKLGVNPFEILLLFAKNDWKRLGYPSEERTRMVGETVIYEPVISADLRANSAAKACEYLYPKRKAIEQSFSDEAITSITRTIIHKAV